MTYRDVDPPQVVSVLGDDVWHPGTLEVCDLDFLRRIVRVQRQLNERGVLVQLKTAGSLRTGPLPGVVADRPAAHLAASGRRSGLILTDRTGAPVKRNSFGKVWRSARDSTGLDASMRLHDLRHAYARPSSSRAS